MGDLRKDAWFAGFTDGEGCFSIARDNRRDSHTPRFGIALRADDAPILEALQKTFGGRIQFYGARDDPYSPSAPQCRWHAYSKRELVALVEYFERFPLRAKKARDYALWRQAVSIYCTSGSADPRLAVLADALRAGRAFNASAMDEADLDDPFEVQLALGIDD